MAKNYSYPRVAISQYAKTRSNLAPAAVDTTILFMPFIAEKGPIEESEYLPIHNLSEFIEKFGNLSYEDNGQTALVIYNWLNAGGTLFPYRLKNYTDGDHATYSEALKDNQVSTDILFKSKYLGKYYVDLELTLNPVGAETTAEKATLSLEIKYNDKSRGIKTALESFRFNKANMAKVLSASELVELYQEVTFEKLLEFALKDAHGVLKNGKTITSTSNLEALVKSFWEQNASTEITALKPEAGARKVLGNVLNAPVDVLIDPGYSKDIKDLMEKFVDNEPGCDCAVRPDIVLLLNEYYIEPTEGKYSGLEVPTNSSTKTYYDTKAKVKHGESEFAHTNVAIWTQYFTISDEIFTGMDIYVTPAYFLSKLLPYNDITYGVQYPTAGLRRGILEDAKRVNDNPTPDEREAYFSSRINYCEKSSREYAFMSQRTWDGSTEAKYTALSFLNNVRALERMKKDLTRLGREYLFEHNDAVTLSQMSNVLNRYMATWTANRTLSYANVVVAPNKYSTEAVDVSLVIKFNNTIEVISVDITIE